MQADEIERLYGERDIIAQGVYYVRHVSAMTGEGLHAKSAIAAELAHRDIQIDTLTSRNAALEAERDRLREALADMAAQHKCGCGHPACNACRRDRVNEDALGLPPAPASQQSGGER